MSKDYSVTITEASREFSAKEKIGIKDFATAVQLDQELDTNDSVIITPVDYAVLEVHNENAKGSKDYTKFIVIDDGGIRYVTGSPSFFTRFREIYDTMKEDAPDETFQITAFKRPSSNYAGKSFISCGIV